MDPLISIILVITAALAGFLIFTGKRNRNQELLQSLISKSDKILLICIVLIFFTIAYLALA